MHRGTQTQKKMGDAVNITDEVDGLFAGDSSVASNSHPSHYGSIPRSAQLRFAGGEEDEDGPHAADDPTVAAMEDVGGTMADCVERVPSQPISRILMLSGTIFALEVGLSLETAYVIPLFAQLGVSERFSSLLFCMGPIFGLFVQPIMGNASDRSTFKWGRRRPFILAISIGMLLGMLLIPNGEWLGTRLGDSNSSHVRGIALCTLGVLLLDFSCDSIQGPCRAYLFDVLPPEQQELGNSVFGIVAGIASCIGYIAGGVDWGPVGRLLGTQLRTVYAVGFLIAAACTICTLVSVAERRPAACNDTRQLSINAREIPRDGEDLHDDQGERTRLLDAAAETHGVARPSVVATSLPAGEGAFSMKEILALLLHPPKPLVRICIVHFFGWLSLLSFVIFFTDYMGLLIYGGDPDAHEGTHERSRYEEGVRIGSLGLATFSFGSSIGSVSISRIVPRFGLRAPYFACYLCTFVGAGVISLTRSLYVAIPMCFLAGGVFCAICTMPYMCLLAYETARGSDGESNGLNVAVVNMMMFVAQLIVSFSMGNIIRAVGTVAFAMYSSSICAAVGAVATFFLVLDGDLRAFTDTAKKDLG